MSSPMHAARWAGVAAIVAFVVVLAGCGASVRPHRAAPPQPSQADRVKAVVRAWTANLNAENNAAEVRLFSLPALISGMAAPYGCYCLTAAEVLQFHVQLLCSVKVVSIKVGGRDATAVFRILGDRASSKCDQPGTLTGVRFRVVRGKITVLQQVWWRGASRLCRLAWRPDPCRQLRSGTPYRTSSASRRFRTPS